MHDATVQMHEATWWRETVSNVIQKRCAWMQIMRTAERNHHVHGFCSDVPMGVGSSYATLAR